MISYIDFKKLFDKLEVGSEIEIYFNNNETYMIVKKNKTLTLGKTKNGKIYEYNNFIKEK